MLGQGLIDGIVPEPLGGAHADPAAAHAFVKAEILAQLPRLLGLSPDKRIDARIRKFSAMGVVTD
jgi:acetyl-CoA carboxylase carboxyl transferase subunit alpha